MKLNLHKELELKQFEYLFGKKVGKISIHCALSLSNYFDYQYTCEPVCSNDVTLMY